MVKYNLRNFQSHVTFSGPKISWMDVEGAHSAPRG
jgi:hypothetical protein